MFAQVSQVTAKNVEGVFFGDSVCVFIYYFIMFQLPSVSCF